MGEFVLDNLSRGKYDGFPQGKIGKYILKWMGHATMALPFDQHISIDFTASTGATSGLYYSLMFQLGKWEYIVQKADEWIEVSPVHQQFYQITQKQKDELEARIKSGLASASQSVADLELMKHDERKYREFLNYFGMEPKDNDFEEKAPDEHSLKAVFIDQVDVHTGEGISMRNIVSRWPTLITDFLKLNDSDLDPEKLKKKLDISKAEAVVLITKNKLYQQWKSMFRPEIISRYKRIKELVDSREESVRQYREWLKPTIARHKLIEEGLSDSGRRKTARTDFMFPSGAYATSSATIDIWAWKSYEPPELYKGGTETLAKELSEKKVDCYDDWTKKNLVFGKENGLINKYPWITDEWINEKKEEMFKDRWIIPNKLYYSFFVIKYMRTNGRSPDGKEFEDGIFDVNSVFFSQNALFVKLLDLKAKQEQLDMYVDNMLGVPHKIKGKALEVKEKEPLKPVRNVLDYFSLPLKFFKRGPYERDFIDRVTKYYLTGLGRDRYGPIVSFIKRKAGFGTS